MGTVTGAVSARHDAERAVVARAVQSWEHKAQSLPEDDRKECIRRVKQSACRILARVNSAKGVSGNDFVMGLYALNKSSRPYCKARGAEKMAEIDAEINKLSSPHRSEHRADSSLYAEIMIGAGAHEIGHRFSKGAGRTFEAACESVLKEPLESKSPIRNRVLSGVSHLGIVETVALASGQIPAWLVVLGSHELAEVAHRGEQRVDGFLNTHSPDEFSDDTTKTEECLDLYQAARVSKAMLKAAQLPSRLIHAVHHEVTETAGKILDTVGVTDENITNAFNQLIRYDHPENSPF